MRPKVWQRAEENSKSYIPPRCIEDKSIDRLPEGRRVKECEKDEASSNEGEARGNTFCNLEVMKLLGSQGMGHDENCEQLRYALLKTELRL